MKDLTIIVPVIDMDKESNQNLFTRAINSVDDSSIIVVGTEKDINIIESLKLDKLLRVLINKSENTSSSRLELLKSIKSYIQNNPDIADILQDKIKDENFSFLIKSK